MKTFFGSSVCNYGQNRKTNIKTDFYVDDLTNEDLIEAVGFSRSFKASKSSFVVDFHLLRFPAVHVHKNFDRFWAAFNLRRELRIARGEWLPREGWRQSIHLSCWKFIDVVGSFWWFSRWKIVRESTGSIRPHEPHSPLGIAIPCLSQRRLPASDIKFIMRQKGFYGLSPC